MLSHSGPSFTDPSKVVHNSNLFNQSFPDAQAIDVSSSTTSGSQMLQTQAAAAHPTVMARAAMPQPKRRRRIANTTEDGNDERKRQKRQRLLPQETSSSRDSKFVRAWLELIGLQPRKTRACDVDIQQLQDLARCMKRDLGDVAELLKAELCFDDITQNEVPVTRPVIKESGHALAQIYANEAFKRQCDRTGGCEGRFQCIFPSCDYQTTKVDALKRHMDVRRPSTVFVCAVCLSEPAHDPFMHQRKDKFRSHLKSSHRLADYEIKEKEKDSTFHPDANVELPCGFCNAKFPALLQFRDHIVDHFKDGDLANEGRLWDVNRDWRESPACESEGGSDSTEDSEHSRADNDESDDNSSDDDGDDGNANYPHHGPSSNFHDSNTGSSGESKSKSQSRNAGPGQGNNRFNTQTGSSYSISVKESAIEPTQLLGRALGRPSLFANHHITYIKHLGHGANGSVDKVKITSTGSMYARKSVVLTTREADIKASFEREIKILRTRSHPNIPRFIDAYIQGTSLNLLMEPAAELNLKEYLDHASGENIGQRDLFAWCGDLASALSALHAPDSNNLSIRHGDIKPSNILVFSSRTKANVSSRLILTDFGASRFVSSDDSESSSTCAMTPMYAAPEIIKKDRHGRQADVFSLACVFLELITFESTGSLNELLSCLQFSPMASRFSSAPTSYSEKIQDVLDWLDELYKRASPKVLPLLDVCRKMLALYAGHRPSASTVSGTLTSSNIYRDPYLEPELYPWLGDGLEPKEDSREDTSNLLEATQNPGGRSLQVMQGDCAKTDCSSDDEIVLPERTSSSQETDDAIRKKVVQHSSDFGQHPVVRALQSTSNLERMQSPHRAEIPSGNERDAMALQRHVLTEIHSRSVAKDENPEEASYESTQYQAIYNYEPGRSKIGHLRLKRGDIVNIITQSASGWLKGTVQGSAVKGWFPSDCCCPLFPTTNHVLPAGAPEESLDPLHGDSIAAVEGWRELEAMRVPYPLSRGASNASTRTLEYFQCSSALVLFTNTRSTLEQLLTLPHAYGPAMDEICVELQALEDTLSDLITVLRRNDKSSRLIVPEVSCIVTQTGMCLKNVFPLRKMVLDSRPGMSGMPLLGPPRPSERDIITMCKKAIRDSVGILDKILGDYRTRVLNLAFKTSHNASILDADHPWFESPLSYDPPTSPYTQAEVSKPTGLSSADGSLSPADLGPHHVQRSLNEQFLSSALSNKRLSQLSEMSTASFVSTDRTSIFSHGSVASTTTSISTTSSMTRKPILASRPPVSSKQNLFTEDAYWECQLLQHCSTVKIPSPEWRISLNEVCTKYLMRVKVGEVSEQSQWHTRVGTAREEAAELVLKKLMALQAPPPRAVDAKPSNLRLAFEERARAEDEASRKDSHRTGWE